MQKSCIIGFWLGSKCSCWQYCQKNSHLKDICPVMYNFLCHYSYHAYFILSHKSEKRVTEWNKRLAFEFYLSTGGNPTSSLFPLTESLKMTCARSYAWFLNFFVRRRGFGLFFADNVLPKLSKINLSYQKSVNINE